MTAGSSSTHPLATAARLLNAGTAYALVTVIRVQTPASARPGDKAVVTADGTFYGWVGGGCAQPAVVKTVRQALVDGKTRMIRITPSEDGERELGDVLEFGMACHSGGTIELLVDPVLPQPQLLIFGTSPVAITLAQLAPRVGFAVTVAASGADGADFPDAQVVLDSDDPKRVAEQVAVGAFVVVATQGRRDLHALNAALAARPRHVSLVASGRKASVLKKSLLATGASAEAVEAIVAPAGYPIAATTPEEIALSVLAAVVAKRRCPQLSISPALEAGCCGPEARGEPLAETGMVETKAQRHSPDSIAQRAETSCCGSASPAEPLPAAPTLETKAPHSCCES
jgi:xanthine dehydrogenase accessory factor